jgi:hypothetical protein
MFVGRVPLGSGYSLLSLYENFCLRFSSSRTSSSIRGDLQKVIFAARDSGTAVAHNSEYLGRRYWKGLRLRDR